MVVKSYEDIISISKDNIDAMIESGTLAAKGFETLAREYADYAARSAENAGAAMQELATCSSPMQLAQLQARLLNQMADSVYGEGRKLVEMAGTVVTASLQPLQARVQAATSGQA